MTALLAAQEQPASSAPATAEAIPTASLDDRFVMPRGRPYGLPPFYAPNTAAGISGAGISGTTSGDQIPIPDPVSLHTTLPQSTVFTEPIIHSMPQDTNTDAYRGKAPVTGTMEERMEELTRELRREIKANRGSGDLVKTHCHTPFFDRSFSFYPSLKLVLSSCFLQFLHFISRYFISFFLNILHIYISAFYLYALQTFYSSCLKLLSA